MAISRTESIDDVVTSAVAPSDIAHMLLTVDVDIVDVEPSEDAALSSADADIVTVSPIAGPSIISRGFSTAQVSKFETVRFITNLKIEIKKKSP